MKRRKLPGLYRYIDIYILYHIYYIQSISVWHDHVIHQIITSLFFILFFSLSLHRALLAAYAKKDKSKLELAKNQNDLESLVYKVRNSLSDDWADVTTEEESDSLRELLLATEDWLFDQPNDLTVENIQNHADKIGEVRAAAKAVMYRASEREIRDDAVAEARRLVKVTL